MHILILHYTFTYAYVYFSVHTIHNLMYRTSNAYICSRDYGTVMHPVNNKKATFLALTPTTTSTSSTTTSTTHPTTPPPTPVVVYKKGQTLTVRVIGFDFNTKVIKVSTDTTLVEAVNRKKGHNSDLDSTKIIPIRIESVEDKYLIGSINGRRDIVCVQTSDYHAPYAQTEESYQVGAITRGKLVCANTHDTLTNEAEAAKSSSPHPFYHTPVYTITTEKEKVTIPKPIKPLTSSTTTSTTPIVTPTATPTKLDTHNLHMLKVGQVFDWQVLSVSALEVELKQSFGDSIVCKGILHVTGALDQTLCNDNLEESLTNASFHTAAALPVNHPFAGIKVGGTLSCRILQIQTPHSQDPDAAPVVHVALSSTPTVSNKDSKSKGKNSTTAGTSTSTSTSTDAMVSYPRDFVRAKGRGGLIENHLYPGAVVKIDALYCLVAVSPFLTLKLSYLDVAKSIKLVKLFKKRCYLGMKVIIGVLSVDHNSGRLTCIVSRARYEEHISTSTPSEPLTNPVEPTPAPHAKVGKLINGMIDLKQSLHPYHPPAYTISFGTSYPPGRLCICEYTDPNPNPGIGRVEPPTILWDREEHDNIDFSTVILPDGKKHGDIVKCRVLSISNDGDGGHKMAVSIRPSRVVSYYYYYHIYYHCYKSTTAVTHTYAPLLLSLDVLISYFFLTVLLYRLLYYFILVYVYVLGMR